MAGNRGGMRPHQARSSEREIIVDGPQTEFEMHAELYCRLKLDGFIVRGELRTDRVRGLVSLARNVGYCRFDLVVVSADGKRAVAIIEVKKSKGWMAFENNQNDCRRYVNYGVPVIVFWDMAAYEKLKNYLLPLI